MDTFKVNDRVTVNGKLAKGTGTVKAVYWLERKGMDGAWSVPNGGKADQPFPQLLVKMDADANTRRIMRYNGEDIAKGIVSPFVLPVANVAANPYQTMRVKATGEIVQLAGKPWEGCDGNQYIMAAQGGRIWPLSALEPATPKPAADPCADLLADFDYFDDEDDEPDLLPFKLGDTVWLTGRLYQGQGYITAIRYQGEDRYVNEPYPHVLVKAANGKQYRYNADDLAREIIRTETPTLSDWLGEDDSEEADDMMSLLQTAAPDVLAAPIVRIDTDQKTLTATMWLANGKRVMASKFNNLIV